MATCTRTDAHPLGECPNYTPAEPAYPVVGAYVEVEWRYKGREPERGVVLVTSLEARADERTGEFTYMGWRNAQPGGGWDRRLGEWGYTRLYADPEARGWGARILRVVPA